MTEEKKEAMIKALEKSLGIVTTACKNTGIAKDTHYRWLKEDKEYRRKVRECENIALDFAETALHRQILKGNPISTIFYLKCRGKKRGYIEESQVEIKGNMKFKADFGESNPVHTPSESAEDPSID